MKSAAAALPVDLNPHPAPLAGITLAASVVLAWALCAALGLPGGWAMMSTLIVVRPTAESTMSAGADRARGSLLGALVALLVAALPVHGVPPMALTLAVVAALAWASATSAAWRSAPITALIVLQATAAGGHPAWQVAGLRVIEIGLGIAAGLGCVAMVGLLAGHGTPAERFASRCELTLRALADAWEASGDGPTGPAALDSTRWRPTLVELVSLGRAADARQRWATRLGRAAAPSKQCTAAHESRARLVGRTLADLSTLARLAQMMATRESAGAQALPQVRQQVADALLACAQAVRGGLPAQQVQSALAALKPDPTSARHPAWLTPALALLLQDLAALASLPATKAGRLKSEPPPEPAQTA